MTAYSYKLTALVTLSAIMIGAGVTHFRSPQPFVSIVPASFPHALALVYVSGFFELAGGAGLLIPITRKAASIGLIALFIAVFPANINMAMNNLPIDGKHFNPWILWLRLPLQFILIAWAWEVGNIKRAEGRNLRPGE